MLLEQFSDADLLHIQIVTPVSHRYQAAFQCARFVFLKSWTGSRRKRGNLWLITVPRLQSLLTQHLNLPGFRGGCQKTQPQLGTLLHLLTGHVPKLLGSRACVLLLFLGVQRGAWVLSSQCACAVLLTMSKQKPGKKGTQTLHINANLVKYLEVSVKHGFAGVEGLKFEVNLKEP